MIKATVIAHSVCANSGKEIITWELEYPRFIHSELMTHRMFSRNAASSRAIPVQKMIDMVMEDPAMPIHWGKNQSGMQAKEELEPALATSAKWLWKQAAKAAGLAADAMNKLGLHKQATNRVLEPYQTMKTVVTYTEGENFFYLRFHEDAQPEIKDLARVMIEAKAKSKPITLQPGWWHVPYFQGGVWTPFHLDEDCTDEPATLEEALAISSSCCAQVSYRLLDESLEKAMMIYKRLVESEPVHASPFEHQATPMKTAEYFSTEDGSPNISEWEEGITHVDRKGKLWSGNFCGFIQHRQLIPNNVVEG